MNTKLLSVALALAAGVSLAPLASAASITTLEAVQVRPSADQLAQQDYERNSDIPTLAALQVRPSAQQEAEFAASQRIVTLAAVQVRPSAEQVAGLGDDTTAQHGRGMPVTVAAAAAMTTLLGEVIIHLPMPQLQPSPADLEALIGGLGIGKVQL